MVLTVLQHREVGILAKREQLLKGSITDDCLVFALQDGLTSIHSQAGDMARESGRSDRLAGLRDHWLLELLGDFGCRHAGLGVCWKADFRHHVDVDVDRIGV